MDTQMLFYGQATPVVKDRHANWSVDTKQNYGFAKRVGCVPLTAVEFPSAASDYVIVFAGAEAPTPVVLLGLQRDTNLFVSDEGKWAGRYIPAFVRRYPFVFATDAEGSKFTLCIDEKFDGFKENGTGERLFDDQGERTDYLSKVLKFLQDYQRHFQRTRAFCRNLKDLDLLEPMQARISLPAGSQVSLTGFQVISRDRLKALEGDKLAALAKTDELELAYLHLHSLTNFRAMIERLGGGAPEPVEH
ncbi:MAG: SapC family protein [Myxococcota bacterium]|nr:SapC family protein [Myxococcota bacterium]